MRSSLVRLWNSAHTQALLEREHRKQYPTGPTPDHKPQERLVQDPAPRLEIHPQSSLDSCHPCAHFGELHHQGTNVRWCNLILAKAGPSLTTGRLYSSLLHQCHPSPPVSFDPSGSHGKKAPLLGLARASKHAAPQRKWHTGISSAQPPIAPRKPASACLVPCPEPGSCVHRALWHPASQRHARSATPSNCQAAAQRLRSLNKQVSQS